MAGVPLEHDGVPQDVVDDTGVVDGHTSDRSEVFSRDKSVGGARLIKSATGGEHMSQRNDVVSIRRRERMESHKSRLLSLPPIVVLGSDKEACHQVSIA